MNHQDLLPGRAARLAMACGLALSLAACGHPEPYFGAVTVNEAAREATLSGATHGLSPAIELSPGCPGYLDPSRPEHLVRLSDTTPLAITARSERGPLSIAVVGAGEVRCDSDEGTGHAPHVTISTPGEYAVYVGALERPEELPYSVEIAPEGRAPTPSAPSTERVAVSVTVTSDPPGAQVRNAEGETLGVTPAMFVIDVPRAELGTERQFILALPDRPPTTVSGMLVGGTLVMHAALAGGPARPGTSIAAGSRVGHEVVVSAESEQPIRDYQVSRQWADVGSDCTIARASVDVNIRHTYIGDLRVVLRSPHGTEVTLHNHSGGSRANLVTTFDWDARRGALQTLAGENARGRWEMAVHDDAGADHGTFRSFTLRLACGEGGALQGSSGLVPRGGSDVASPSTTPPRTTGRSSGGGVLDPWARRPPPRPRPRPAPTPTPPVVVRPHPRPAPTPPTSVTGHSNPVDASGTVTRPMPGTVLDPWH